MTPLIIALCLGLFSGPMTWRVVRWFYRGPWCALWLWLNDAAFYWAMSNVHRAHLAPYAYRSKARERVYRATLWLTEKLTPINY